MAYDHNSDEMLSYAPERGMNDLVEEIEKWLINRGFDLSNEMITVIPGSGSGMDIMALAFCDKGDTILYRRIYIPWLTSFC